MNKLTKNIFVFLIINLIIVLALVFFLKPSWEIGGDGFGYYSYLRSGIFDQDFTFFNEYQEFDRVYNTNQLANLTPVNKTANMFSVGPAILWTPFILTAYVREGELHSIDDQYQLTGFNYSYQLAIFVATLVYFILGLLFVYLALRILFPGSTAFWTTMSIWLISPLVYYLIYEPSMSHVLSFFTVSGLFYFVIKHYDTVNIKKYFVFGLWLGLAMLVRWQNIIFGFLPLILLLIERVSDWKKKIKSLIVFLLTSFIVFLPQLLMWKHIYGSYIAIPQGGGFFNLFNPHIWSFLFSSYHGLFIWHPLLLIGLIGLFFLWRKNKTLAAVIFVTLLAQIYINSALGDWMAGSSFGARRIIGSLVIFAIWMASLYDFFREKNKKVINWIIGLIILFGLGWNILLMISVARGVIQLNSLVTMGEIFSKQFQVLLTIIFGILNRISSFF